MTPPTDLRAALRDAADIIRDELAMPDPFADSIERKLRALADAPPTVAELLPRVDATHEVHWEAHGEERRVYAPDGGAIVAEYRTGRMRWMEAHLTVFDLRRPAKIVKVAP